MYSRVGYIPVELALSGRKKRVTGTRELRVYFNLKESPGIQYAYPIAHPQMRRARA